MTLSIAQIQSLDCPDFLNWPELINKRSRNAPKSKNGLPTFLEENRLNKDVSITLLEPIPKI